MVKPGIGDTVLFKIDSADFGVWRPLLVTYVHDDGSVDGELFLSWERDRRAEWPSKYLFWGLDPAHRTCEVRNVKAGDALGGYKHIDIFEGIEKRLAAIEKANESRGKLMQPPAKALVPEKRTK